MKPRVISGIQPTGKLHIGNYLGALRNFVDIQNSGTYECYFFIADLHSLTEYNWKTSAEKYGQILDTAANFLAVGLTPRASVIFQQSRVSAHTELGWILNTITPIGELSRMTQFKDKGEERSSANAGLLVYPTLMAADILLYNTAYVPVGSDQDQHLEITRVIARKFNKRFPGRAGGDVFREPKPLYTNTPRIMSIDDPLKKMSKSRPAGCLFIDDEPEIIHEKVKRAITDSGTIIAFNEKEKPAISNLLAIYASIERYTPKDAESRFKDTTYAQFKEELAKRINAALAPIREAKQQLLRRPAKIESIIRHGSKRAEAIASKQLEEARRRIGLVA